MTGLDVFETWMSCTRLWLHVILSHYALIPGCPTLYTTTHSLFYLLLSTSHTTVTVSVSLSSSSISLSSSSEGWFLSFYSLHVQTRRPVFPRCQHHRSFFPLFLTATSRWGLDWDRETSIQKNNVQKSTSLSPSNYIVRQVIVISFELYIRASHKKSKSLSNVSVKYLGE